jgi:hypothetical protein
MHDIRILIERVESNYVATAFDDVGSLVITSSVSRKRVEERVKKLLQQDRGIPVDQCRFAVEELYN